jgi:hypothetical protein
VEEAQVDLTRIVNWLSRALRLDSTAFDEIKVDPSGLVAGIAVVAVTNLIIGIGTYLYAEFEDFPETSDLLVRAVIIGTVVQTVAWMAWPGVSYLLINSVFRGTANVQQMIATMGFAYAPAVVSFLIFITFLDWPFAILGMVAAFVLTQYAIAASSNAGSSQITMANLAGFAAFAIVMGLVAELTTDDEEPGGYAFANGIWFLDSVAGLTTDGLGAAADANGGDFDADDALELCRDQAEEAGFDPDEVCASLE